MGGWPAMGPQHASPQLCATLAGTSAILHAWLCCLGKSRQLACSHCHRCSGLAAQIWGREPCKIATLVGSRSCRQVHARLQELAGPSEGQDAEGQAAEEGQQRRGKGRKQARREGGRGFGV